MTNGRELTKCKDTIELEETTNCKENDKMLSNDEMTMLLK